MRRSPRDAPVTLHRHEPGSPRHVVPTEATALVVEADDLHRRQVVDRLSERFGRVLEAPSAEMALYVCGSHAVDVVATAACLPGMGAAALCTELADHDGPPVVAYRVPGDGTARAAWLEAGGADYTGSADPTMIGVRCRAVLGRDRTSSSHPRRGGRSAAERATPGPTGHAETTSIVRGPFRGDAR